MSVYAEWLQAASALKPLKALEMSLRKEIVFKFLTQSDKSQTKTVEDEGYTIKAKTGVTAALDKELVKAHWKDLSLEDQQAILWSPSLVAKNYNLLPEDSLLRTFVTKKPATPTLAITQDELSK